MFKRLVAASFAVAIIAGACSSNGGSTQGVAGATASGAAAATSEAASAPASAPASAAAATLMTMDANGKTVLVAGSNGMTVYTFTHDVANSGKSACTGGCLAIWPAVTVPDGTTPTAAAGISGKLGTIKRADDGTTEVTYNGLPLYFYAKDTKPGDTLGNYPSWNLVTP